MNWLQFYQLIAKDNFKLLPILEWGVSAVGQGNHSRLLCCLWVKEDNWRGVLEIWVYQMSKMIVTLENIQKVPCVVVHRSRSWWTAWLLRSFNIFLVWELLFELGVLYIAHGDLKCLHFNIPFTLLSIGSNKTKSKLYAFAVKHKNSISLVWEYSYRVIHRLNH